MEGWAGGGQGASSEHVSYCGAPAHLLTELLQLIHCHALPALAVLGQPAHERRRHLYLLGPVSPDRLERTAHLLVERLPAWVGAEWSAWV